MLRYKHNQCYSICYATSTISVTVYVTLQAQSVLLYVCYVQAQSVLLYILRYKHNQCHFNLILAVLRKSVFGFMVKYDYLNTAHVHCGISIYNICKIFLLRDY